MSEYFVKIPSKSPSHRNILASLRKGTGVNNDEMKENPH